MPTLPAQTSHIGSAHRYEEAIAHLNSLVPELFVAPAVGVGAAQEKPKRRKFSLDQIGMLTAALGRPQEKFPAVLIAGTNGKGSTASTLAAIAAAAGLRTGLYTSPHLERVNERIKIVAGMESAEGRQILGGSREDEPGTARSLLDIPDATFARLYFHVLETAQRLVDTSELPGLPSYFELLTAVAFCFFAEPEPGAAPVDLAILEVGMGGRLDATNIVTPIVSVITDIALDHQEWLGGTITEIAREKAGILRRDGVLVTLPQHPEANQALGEIAVELGVRGVNAAQYTPRIRTSPLEPYEIAVLGKTVLIDSPLHGAHQHRNLALAIATAVELAEHHGFPITAEAIEAGIRETRWPARLELLELPGSPEILLDVAHNPAGAWALRAALSAADERDGLPASAAGAGQVLIFSCLRDKPLMEMAQILFPVFDHLILAPIHSPRATPVAELAAAAEATGVAHTEAASIAEAISEARALHPRRIVISGSLYLVGEARALLLHPNVPTARQFAS
ncbi:MAG TPA: folylpolyglutamate synthase/dihydrofolate synthase family protein [Acidobacteriaceae bacterium]